MAVSSRSLNSPLVGQSMKHRPFGVDEQDRPIQQIQSRLIIGVVTYMQTYIAQQALERNQPAAHIEAKQLEALRALVTRLNLALPDPRLHITAADLMQANRWYSLEFSLFVGEYARLLSGDPDFYFNVGGYMIPKPLLVITRPLSLRQAYLRLPALMTRLAKTRLDVIDSTSQSMHLRWYPDLSEQRPDLRPLHIAASCDMWRGAFAALPRLRNPSLPLASVNNLVCAKDGFTEYCEWNVIWADVTHSERINRFVIVGLAVTVIAIAMLYSLGHNGVETVLFAMFIVTNALGILYTRSVRLALASNLRQLSEQRDFAQQQYHDVIAVTADLHTTNARLEQRVNELTTLHQIGQMLSETAPFEQLIEKSFTALLKTLPYSGLMLFVVNEADYEFSMGWAMKQPLYVLNALPVSNRARGDALLTKILERTSPLMLEDVILDGQLEAFEIKSLIGIPLSHRRHPVGVLIAYYTLSHPLDIGDGPLLMTIGAQMAAALDNAALYRTLEERVQKRTFDLQKATTQAQAAQRERTEFIARMNHELRTPLQAILGFAEILVSDTSLSQTQRDQTRIIVEHAERLVGMIATAIQVARLEAEKGVLQIQRIDVKPFIMSVIQDTLGETQRRLKFNFETVPPALHTDQDKLRLVLQNLLRFLSQRAPDSTLYLRLYYRRRLYFELWSEGESLTEEQLHDVVRLFTRPYNTLTTHNTGLRLSITYQLVMLLGGILSVALQPSGGLVFRFDIPALTDSNVPDAPPVIALPPPSALPQGAALENWTPSSMPGIMRDALRKAARRGDLTAMQETLDILAAQQPELANALDGHMTQFEFDVILNWLDL